MADIIKYACSSATKLHKQFQRVGAAVRSANSHSKRTIVDGYIVSTRADKSGSVTTVIDTPASLAFPGVHVNVDNEVSYIYCVPLTDDRDIFTPGNTKDITPVVGDTKRYAQPAGHKYVGMDTPMDRTPDNSIASGRSRVDGRWLSMAFTASYRRPIDDVFISNLNAYAINWASPLDVVSQPYEIDRVIELTVPVEVLTALYPAWRLQSVFSEDPVAVPAACVVDTPNEGGGITTSLYIATLMAPVVSYAATGFRRAILVIRIDIVPGRPQTFSWTRLVPISPYVYDPSDVGWEGYTCEIRPVLHDAPLATALEVVCVYGYPHPGEGVARTTTLSLVASSGADLSAAVDTGTSLPATQGVACSTINASWGGNIGGSFVSGAYPPDYSAPLIRVSNGVTSAINLDGWLPACIYFPGMSSVLPVTHVMRFVTDLSPGRVGVVAAPAGTYTTWGYADFHLLELDELSMEVVSVRGYIGTAQVPGVGDEFSRHISTVTPQVVDGAGVVTTPAVLLCCIGDTTRLSTDGGYTWRVAATGVISTPVYMGNGLHPFILGEAL